MVSVVMILVIPMMKVHVQKLGQVINIGDGKQDPPAVIQIMDYAMFLTEMVLLLIIKEPVLVLVSLGTAKLELVAFTVAPMKISAMTFYRS